LPPATPPPRLPLRIRRLLLLPASRHRQHSPKLCFGRNAPANYYTNINSDVKPSQFLSIVYGSPYNLVHKEHSKGEKKQE